MFDTAELDLLEEILDRDWTNSHLHECSYEDYLQGRLEDYRQAPNLDFAREVTEAELAAMTDAEAIDALVRVEEGIARAHATRARLITRIAADRPAVADRPAGRPGARADGEAEAEVVPEVVDVSEWLAHELQMAHPYSLPAAQDLVETSLVLCGRLCASLDLLRRGRIDYRRARVLSDLLGTCTVEVAHTVEAMVLAKAPGLTPGGLASAVRHALARVDAAAMRRRHARARKSADVCYYPTQDGMARLVADLPLPVAAVCVDAIRGYARSQQAEGDGRPVGQISRTNAAGSFRTRPEAHARIRRASRAAPRSSAT